MPRTPKKPQPSTVFGKNLLAVIEFEAARRREVFSVNAWAIRHGFTQTTVARMLNTQDPSTKLVAKAAEAAGLEPWAMLVPDLDPQNPPVLYGLQQKELIDRLKKKIGETAEILQGGNTRPGSFDEIASNAVSDAPAPPGRGGRRSQ
jgi:hypothetical protein